MPGTVGDEKQKRVDKILKGREEITFFRKEKIRMKCDSRGCSGELVLYRTLQHTCGACSDCGKPIYFK